MNRRNLLLTGAAAAVGALAGGARAQSDNTLRLIVPYAPGGSSDRAARIVADKLTARLGGPVVVDNKTGAGGRLAMQQTKGLPASQNVLVLANPATMVVAPLVFKDNGYDPDKDFQPVSQVSDYEFGVAVATAVPVKEIKHLLAWLRANPNQANFGVPATGSLPHFFGLMTGEKAQIPAQVVGYRGSGPLLTDLIGGQVPVAFDTFDTLLPQHEAGKLRILASAAPEPGTGPLAGVKTWREQGVPADYVSYNGVTLPPSVNAEQIRFWEDALRQVAQDGMRVRASAGAGSFRRVHRRPMPRRRS